MNPLETYLARVAHELRSLPIAKREDELRELRSHLEQRSEDFENGGLQLEAAQTRAIREFGSARSVGSKLCDAWEGIYFSTWRLISTLVLVTLYWLITSLVIMVGALALPHWNQAALFPELPYVFAILFVLVPFHCGWLFSRRLGRRGPVMAFLFFTMLAYLIVYLYAGLNVSTISLATWFLNVIMAVSGAVFGYDLRRQQLRLAFANGQTSQTLFYRAYCRYARPIALGLFLVACVAFPLRVYTVFHPTTPTATLAASLLTDQSMNSHEMQPLKILDMRELEPTTAAERAGKEEWVSFRLEASANPEYAARRLAFLQHELSSTAQRKSWGEQALRSSLQRLQLTRHVIEGKARLALTPGGWQVDENSFDRSQLWAWCYDIYYE